MDFFTAIILGIVEGLTEFLPISSTGHLILAAQLLNVAQTNFVKSFEITIQLGSIFSVLVLYWRSLLLNFKILKRIIVAFIPTGVIGLALYKIFRQYLLGNEQVVLLSLFLGGIFLVVFELWHKEKESHVEDLSKLSYKKSFLIGIFQSISIIPGVSRSAATIIGGLTLSVKRKAIVEFSFLLAVPTMLAATGLDLVENASLFSIDQLDFLLVGFIASFVVAILAIKFFLNYIKKHTFIPFGIYRILIALLFWILVLGAIHF